MTYDERRWCHRGRASMMASTKGSRECACQCPCFKQAKRQQEYWFQRICLEGQAGSDTGSPRNWTGSDLWFTSACFDISKQAIKQFFYWVHIWGPKSVIYFSNWSDVKSLITTPLLMLIELSSACLQAVFIQVVSTQVVLIPVMFVHGAVLCSRVCDVLLCFRWWVLWW